MVMWSYLDKRARRLGILDTKLVQGASMFFALAIAKIFPRIMNVNISWFIILAIVFAVRPFFTFYLKNYDS
jgi:hypothetical protein